MLRALLFFAVLIAYSHQDVSDYWSADYTTDETFNNGILTHQDYGDAVYAQGVCNEAFVFGNSSWYPSYDLQYGYFGGDDFTISFWISSSEAPNGSSSWAIISKRTGCDFSGHWWSFQLGSTGSILFQMYDETKANPITYIQTKPIADGEFHHIAVVRQSTDDSSVTSIWTDGEQDQQVTGSVLVADNLGSLYFGHDACEQDGSVTNAASALFLDEIKIFLDAEDPLQIYQTRCGSTAAPAPASNTSVSSKKKGSNVDQFIIAGIFLSIGIIIVIIIILLLTRSKRDGGRPKEKVKRYEVKIPKESDDEIVSPKKQSLEDDDTEIQTPKRSSIQVSETASV